MKKSIALLLLSLYLFSTTEFHELLKVPALVEHFAEHQEKDSSISLWKFLCIHYAHGEVNDADHSKDMKLPYKTHDNCNNVNPITILLEQKICFNTVLIPPVKKDSHKYYSSFCNSNYLQTIWQPPKFS